MGARASSNVLLRNSSYVPLVPSQLAIATSGMSYCMTCCDSIYLADGSPFIVGCTITGETTTAATIGSIFTTESNDFGGASGAAIGGDDGGGDSWVWLPFYFVCMQFVRRSLFGFA